MIKWIALALSITAAPVEASISWIDLQHEMNLNREAAYKVFDAHIKSLEWHIDNGQILNYGPYTKWIDATDAENLGERMLGGLKNMRSNIGELEWVIECNPNEEVLVNYVWVHRARFPTVKFCDIEVYMIKDFTMYVYHEMAHFYEPEGMNAFDVTYDYIEARDLSFGDPIAAISNAYNIHMFMLEPPPPTPPTVAALSIILELILN